MESEKRGGGLSAALLREMFNRDRASAMMTLVGVVALTLLHYETVAGRTLAGWSAFMLSIAGARFFYALRSLKALPSSPALYTVFCALLGLGWGSTVYLFDGGGADQLYYLRLLVLSAALASSTGTLSVVAAPFAAFTLSIFIPGVLSFLLSAHGGRMTILLFCSLLYLLAIFAIGRMNRLRHRAGVAEHLARVAAMEELERKNAELSEALSRISELEGILPICASCKKIRDESGQWHHVETYIESRSKAEFSHGCCPDCMRELYPEYSRKKAANGA